MEKRINFGYECFDLIQLAFYLADKYRMVVIVLSDAFTGLGQEYVEVRRLDAGGSLYIR